MLQHHRFSETGLQQSQHQYVAPPSTTTGQGSNESSNGTESSTLAMAAAALIAASQQHQRGAPISSTSTNSHNSTSSFLMNQMILQQLSRGDLTSGLQQQRYTEETSSSQLQMTPAPNSTVNAPALFQMPMRGGIQSQATAVSPALNANHSETIFGTPPPVINGCQVVQNLIKQYQQQQQQGGAPAESGSNNNDPAAQLVQQLATRLFQGVAGTVNASHAAGNVPSPLSYMHQQRPETTTPLHQLTSHMMSSQAPYETPQLLNHQQQAHSDGIQQVLTALLLHQQWRALLSDAPSPTLWTNTSNQQQTKLDSSILCNLANIQLQAAKHSNQTLNPNAAMHVSLSPSPAARFDSGALSSRRNSNSENGDATLAVLTQALLSQASAAKCLPQNFFQTNNNNDNQLRLFLKLQQHYSRQAGTTAFNSSNTDRSTIKAAQEQAYAQFKTSTPMPKQQHGHYQNGKSNTKDATSMAIGNNSFTAAGGSHSDTAAALLCMAKHLVRYPSTTNPTTNEISQGNSERSPWNHCQLAAHPTQQQHYYPPSPPPSQQNQKKRYNSFPGRDADFTTEGHLNADSQQEPQQNFNKKKRQESYVSSSSLSLSKSASTPFACSTTQAPTSTANPSASHYAYDENITSNSTSALLSFSNNIHNSYMMHQARIMQNNSFNYEENIKTNDSGDSSSSPRFSQSHYHTALAGAQSKATSSFNLSTDHSNDISFPTLSNNDAVAALRTQPQGPKSPSHNNISRKNRKHRATTKSLARTQDHDWLSERECFLRKHCVELFEATASDIVSNANGRRNPINIGQVGIRCVFCAPCDNDKIKNSDKIESTFIDGSCGSATACSSNESSIGSLCSTAKHGSCEGKKAPRAVCFASSLRMVQKAFENWRHLHFPACPQVPSEIRRAYEQLKCEHSVIGSLDYRTETLSNLLVDLPGGGVRFRDDDDDDECGTNQDDDDDDEYYQNQNKNASNESICSVNSDTSGEGKTTIAEDTNEFDKDMNDAGSSDDSGGVSGIDGACSNNSREGNRDGDCSSSNSHESRPREVSKTSSCGGGDLSELSSHDSVKRNL